MGKKTLIRIPVIIFVVLLIVFTTAAVLIHFMGDRALKVGIETAATQMLNVDVTLSDVSLSLLTGVLELEGLIIANPSGKGYQHPNLLELGRAQVDVDVKSLLSEVVNIETMKFDEVTLVIEQKGFTNNLQEVLDSIPSPSAPAEEKQQEERAPGKQLHIDELEITNITAKVKLLPIPGRADTITLHLDPIRMTDLGKDGKLDTAELAGKVMVALASGIARQGAGLLPKDLLGSMQAVLENQGEVFIETGKKILTEGRDAGSEIIKEGKDIGKEAAEAFKGLFKRKDEK